MAASLTGERKAAVLWPKRRDWMPCSTSQSEARKCHCSARDGQCLVDLHPKTGVHKSGKGAGSALDSEVFRKRIFDFTSTRPRWSSLAPAGGDISKSPTKTHPVHDAGDVVAGRAWVANRFSCVGFVAGLWQPFVLTLCHVEPSLKSTH